MATVIPFKGLRPPVKLAQKVASRSVTQYSAKEINEELKTNPYSFLQVLNPEFGSSDKTKPNSAERLQKIKNKYSSFINKKIFVKDKKEAYYIYKQVKGKKSYIGIIGCSSVDDYINGVIKVHEQTLSEREKKLKNYLDVCDFNAEPVLFFYQDNIVLNALIAKVAEHTSDYDFITEDNVRHQLWIIHKKSDILAISTQFEKIKNIYIADGHHRSASSVLHAIEKRRENGRFSGKEAFNFYLGIYFAQSQLKIYNYNRAVKGLNNLSKQAFLNKIKQHFTICQTSQQAIKPIKHSISMYFDGYWYLLQLKNKLLSDTTIDAGVLNEYLLSPVLGIKDFKKDKRIKFVQGTTGANTLKMMVDRGECDVAFNLYPVSFGELKKIADKNQTMPPKSTWIEPKLRSGLVIYELEDRK